MVLGREHLEVARRQLPDLSEDQFIVEPVGGDTAPASAFHAHAPAPPGPRGRHDRPPADHYIPGHGRLCAAPRAAPSNGRGRATHLVTIGIRPTRPEVGYGYIYAGDRAGSPRLRFRVGRFVEKPDEAKAALYLAEGNYLLEQRHLRVARRRGACGHRAAHAGACPRTSEIDGAAGSGRRGEGGKRLQGSSRDIHRLRTHGEGR